jgi:molybdate transport system regulatory protein
MITMSIRIDLPNGSRLGPGKVALLEAVHRHRSISAAARDIDMSYRRAWSLIGDMNRAFSETVVETFPGRSQGAGAAVTPFGERLVATYRTAERRCQKSAYAALQKIAQSSNPHYDASEITRHPKRSTARDV